MPGKSRRKGKYSIQGKKQGGPARPAAVAQSFDGRTQVHQATAISSPSATPNVVPASPRVVPARPARGAAHVQMDKPVAIRFAFVTKELRTIGILAGLMLIILVVLARVLA
ncbi:MAG: hypothetical protein AABZ77_06580 [Chloroflexota bacterium]